MERDWKITDLKNPLLRADRYISWILGVTALAYFLIFTIHAYSYDALAYAGDVVSSLARDQFHPHHLIYNRANWLFFRLVNLIVSNTGPLVTMSWFNSILGALTVVIFYRLAVRLNGKRLISCLLALILVTSRGFQIFSAMPETVIPPIFFLLLAYYVALFKSGNKTGPTILLAVIFSIAVMFHQTSLLYLPGLALILWFGGSKNRRWIQLGILLCLSILLIAAAYISVIWLCLGMAPSQWVTYPTYYLHSTLGGSGAWYDWSGAITYWFSVGNSSFINPSKFNWENLVFVGRILVWGLVIPAMVITFMQLVRKVVLGLIIVLQLMIVLCFFSWWLVNCEDYWVMPWVLLLVLVAWALRYFDGRIAAIWLCFYIPIGLLTNWIYQISNMVNPAIGHEEQRLVDYISRRYCHDCTVLISEQWNLCLRGPIVGIDDLNWREKCAQFDDVAGDLNAKLEANPGTTILCSDYVKNALETGMLEDNREEKFASLYKSIKEANVMPEFDGIKTREKIWVMGSGTGSGNAIQ
jgi:hypothetical protein